MTSLKSLYLSSNMMTAEETEQYVKENSEQRDYTAFEVFPTNVTIPAGTVDSASSIEGKTTLKDLLGWDQETCEELSASCTGLAYSEDVSAKASMELQLATTVLKENSDVTIDWGDGSKTTLLSDAVERYDDKDSENWKNYNSAIVVINHTYSGDYVNRKNIVKVHGTGYYTLRHYPWQAWEGTDYVNIISRVLAHDLKVSENLLNTSSMCSHSDRILEIKCPYMYESRIRNFSGMFGNCKNLKKADIDDSLFMGELYAAQSMFHSCKNLECSNVRLPSIVNIEGIKSFYYGCHSLTSNISSLLPLNGFSTSEINIDHAFFQCSSLTGSVPSEKLWDAYNVNFISYDGCFSGCSKEIRDQVPYMWAAGSGNISVQQPDFSTLKNINDYISFNKYVNYRLNDIEKMYSVDNLYDSEYTVDGGYYNDKGTVILRENCQYNTKFIKVKGGSRYLATRNSLNVVQYDENFRFISRIQSGSATQIQVSDNAKYIKISIYESSFDTSSQKFVFAEESEFDATKTSCNPIVQISTENILSDSITTSLIKDGQVTYEKLADGVIDASRFSDGSIPYSKLSTDVAEAILSDTLEVRYNEILHTEQFTQDSDGVTLLCTDASINGSGHPSAYNGWRIFSLTAAYDFDIWYDASVWKPTLVRMAVYQNEFDKNFISPRYQSDGSSPNIPTESNKLHITKGQVIAINGAFSSFVLKRSYSTENIQIYTPTNDGKVLWTLSHQTNIENNYDIWRIYSVKHTDDANNTDFDVTNAGEIEMAVKFDGNGFIGGSTHGNEKMISCSVFVDNVYANINAVSDGMLKKCKQIKMIESTNLYDSSDTTHTKIIGKHLREYSFDKTGLILSQRINWLSSVTIESAYLGMFTPCKNTVDSSTGNTIKVTDYIYTDCDFQISQIPPEFKTPYPTSLNYTNVSQLTMFANDRNTNISFELISQNIQYESTTLDETNSYFMVTDNGNNYNKVYSVIKPYTTKSGNVWKNVIRYQVNVGK